MVPEKRFSFPPFLFFFFFFLISIPNVNCFLDQFTEQFINVIATNNDLLTDELNVIYFAPKLWLYIKDPQKKYRLGTVSKIFYWRA